MQYFNHTGSQTRVGVVEHEGSARGPLRVDTEQKSDKYLPTNAPAAAWPADPRGL